MKHFFTLFFIMTISIVGLQAQTPAFPGAGGGGMYTTGGRGGAVYFVNSLEDTNTGDLSTRSGTLRWCLGRSGAKTIIFKVSGIIELTSRLSINDNTTIAGQTAPGDGICLKNYSLYQGGDNVIVRYIRSRLGDEKGTQDDAMWGRNQQNIIIDHCSFSWSIDECGSFYDNKNFTLQWCILSESLRQSLHDKDSHGYGGIWGGQTATFHHNILAHHDSRNPRMNGSRYSGQPELELVDFRNNVIYNWGGNSGYAGEGGNYNFINNYYKAGPESSNKTRIFSPNDKDGVWGTFYVNGNKVTESTFVTDNNWQGIEPKGDLPGLSIDNIKSETEFEVPHVTTQSADEAYELVLQYCGANLKRDETDARVINEIRNGLAPERASNGTTRAGLIDTQSDVGGWDDYTYQASVVPEDTDLDGMPDEWETRNGLNPNDASDRNLLTTEGYTNLEVYINGLVESSIFVSNKTETLVAIKDFIVYQGADKNSAIVQFTNTTNQKSLLTVYDVMGRNIYHKSIDSQNSNLQKLELNTTNFNKGIYFVNLATGNSKQTQKFILK